MKKTNKIIINIFIIFTFTIFAFSCKTPVSITSKSGAQLWGENCQRCHNIPSPVSFNDEHWDIIATHMKIKANLTSVEEEKIAEFLKASN